MILSFKNTWFLFFAGSFLFALTGVLILFPGYFIPAMTLLSVIVGGFIIAYAGIEKFFPFLLFSLPISFLMPFSGSSTLMFPSELLAVAVSISVIVKFVIAGTSEKYFLSHPVTVLLGLYIFSLIITAFFSEMLMVSIKSIMMKIIYAVAFYGGTYFYVINSKKITYGLLYYFIPFIAVIIYILIQHYEYSFSKDVAGIITKPFFNDHTIYSAVIAFFLPVVAGWFYLTRGWNSVLLAVAFLFLLVAIFFAGSRAAWLSVAVAFLIWALLKLRLPASGFLIILIGLISIAAFKSDDIHVLMKSNRSDSNARNAGIVEQTRSVSNITNDQSNSERINRWKCAWRMFKEKPFTGFGPGTYQFSYLSFQREYEMTRISVKTPYNIIEGRGGTAHNEFLLVLSESGIFTALFFLLSILFTFTRSIKMIYTSKNFTVIKIALLLALSTFTVHSFFNNFMDTDKMAFLFYFSISWLISMELNGAKRMADE